MQAKAEFSIICLITKYVKCFHLHKYPHIHVLDFLQNIFIYLGSFRTVNLFSSKDILQNSS